MPLGGGEEQSQLAEAKETRGRRLMEEETGRNRFKGLHSLEPLLLISGCPGLTPIIGKLACTH